MYWYSNFYHLTQDLEQRLSLLHQHKMASPMASSTSIQTLGSPTEDMFTTVQNTKLTQFCLQFQMTVLCDEHPLTTLEGLVDAIFTAEQGLSEAPFHLSKVILITPW